MKDIKLTHKGEVKTMKKVKAEYLHQVLKKADYSIVKAAELSGLTVTTISAFFNEHYERETIISKKEK